jgi:CubicO group peptidase (beta-lactamase class C family)
MSYSHYVQQHLFAPAGMQHSFVLDGSAKLPASTVKGYITGDNGKVKRSSLPTVITGDGNIYSSIDDLAHWLAALESDKVVSPDLLGLAYQNGRFDNGRAIKDEDGNGYGFGWVVPPHGKRVWHTGSWYGTASYIVRDLDTTTDVVVLSNDENADVAQLGDDILDLF